MPGTVRRGREPTPAPSGSAGEGSLRVAGHPTVIGGCQGSGAGPDHSGQSWSPSTEGITNTHMRPTRHTGRHVVHQVPPNGSVADGRVQPSCRRGVPAPGVATGIGTGHVVVVHPTCPDHRSCGPPTTGTAVTDLLLRIDVSRGHRTRRGSRYDALIRPWRRSHYATPRRRQPDRPASRPALPHPPIRRTERRWPRRTRFR